MEESVSGFKQTGDWGTIVAHGEKITAALEQVDANNSYSDAFNEWNEWRPKLDERLSNEVNEKTAVKASVGEGVGEKNDEKINENLKEANSELKESVKRLKKKDSTDEMIDSWKTAIQQTGHAADTTSRSMLRKLEQTVYQNVMTVIAPYYFDNELISANIQKNRDDTYTLEININPDEMKNSVSDLFDSYDSDQEIEKHFSKHEYEPSKRAKDAEGIE